MIEQILLIAVLQGITEFLPISSSGHLNLLHGLSIQPDQGLTMDVAVHMGTLVAVVIYNWRDITRMFISFFTFGRQYREFYGVSVSALIATIPVLVAGFLLNRNHALLEILRSVEVIAWATLIFGIVLGIADRSTGHRRLTTTSMLDAVIIGLAQVLALIPGTSRSGITMTAARGMGLSRRAAARFSMILSIPVILGSGVLKGIDLLAVGGGEKWVEITLAAVIAMVVALGSINVMMAILARVGFMPFVIYRIILGGALLGMVYFV
ncbi:undecaprenyl-diphosphate phosphatase [Alphaproteobacteria bacterium LSUCC0684]